MEHSPDTHSTFLHCKDHLVSGASFDLLFDSTYEMLVTHPQPKPEELASYYQSDEYISHTDSRRSLLDVLYQLVKRIALRKKRRLLESYTKGPTSILDLGTGTGDFLVAMQKHGWNIQGVEPNKGAREKALAKNVPSLEDSHSLGQNTFDCITMWHVLEHIPDVEQQISELKRLLRPDGYLFIAVPNFKSYDAQVYHEFWAAYDVPRHLYHFSRVSIEKLFTKSGFNLVDIHPMIFDAYYVSMLSERYKNRKGSPIKAFLTGFRSNRQARRNGEYSSLIYVLQATNKAK